MPVNGRPFLEYQFEQLAKQGLTSVLLCVGFGSESICDHAGDGSAWGVQVEYSLEDADSLLGTGGALVNALPHLEPEFMTLYGDSYLPVDFRAVADRFHEIGLPYLMTVFRNEGKWDASNTQIEGDRVAYYNKKALPGETDYIDYGLSVMRRDVIERYSAAPMPLDMARIQQELVEEGQVGAMVVTERFYEIGKPEGLSEFEAWIPGR